MPLTQVRTGVGLHHEITGEGEPLLVVMGTSGALGLWGDQAQAVADRIPGARYELVTGPGSSHCLHLERPEDLVGVVSDFLTEHPLEG